MFGYAIRQAIGSDTENIGFKLNRKKITQYKPPIITDPDFADDIAPMTEYIKQA